MDKPFLTVSQTLRGYKPFIKRYCNIKNRSLSDEHSERLEVPVLANHFNRKRMINEWTLRGLFEYKRSIQTFFCTLTYNEEHLPRMADGRPCFCPDHITDFIKAVQHQLDCDGLGRGVMKHFVVSEYGKTTKRPHYHAVFYFSVPVVFGQGQKLIQGLGALRKPKLHDFSFGYFHDLVRKYWRYGFSDIQIPRSGDAVVKYISGYVCKDLYSMDITMSRYDESVLERVLEWKEMKGKPSRKTYDPEIHVLKNGKWYKKYERVYTTYNFHRQSLHFGDNLLDSITMMNWLSGTIQVTDGDKVYIFAIPKYAKDKMLRTLVPFQDEFGNDHVRSKLTELGKQVRENVVKHYIDSVQSDLEKFSNSLEWVSSVLGYDVDYDTFNLDLYYNSNEVHYSKSVQEDFDDYMRNRRHWELVTYGKPCHYLDYSQLGSFFWTSPCGDTICVRHDPNNPDRKILWNEYYQGYERMLKILDQLNFSLQCSQQRADEERLYQRDLNKRFNRS